VDGGIVDLRTATESLHKVPRSRTFIFLAVVMIIVAVVAASIGGGDGGGSSDLSAKDSFNYTRVHISTMIDQGRWSSSEIRVDVEFPYGGLELEQE
jgi:hypothetical protein